MRIIKNARLTAVAQSPVSSDSMLVFTARMRIGGRRAKRFLLCHPKEVIMAWQGELYVVHNHSNSKPNHLHKVLFIGEDL